MTVSCARTNSRVRSAFLRETSPVIVPRYLRRAFTPDKRMSKTQAENRKMAAVQVTDRRMVDGRVDDQRKRMRKSNSSKSDSGSSTCSEWMDIKNMEQYKQSHTCLFCDKEFRKRNLLAIHVKNNCLKNPAATCNIQDMNRPYLCTTCGCRFGKRKALNYHERHVCQKTVTCQICNTEMSGSTVIARHTIRCKQKLASRRRRSYKEDYGAALARSQIISSSSDDDV